MRINKGFTLVELLAVIVIIAIIATITTPIILNVLNDAKVNSFKDDALSLNRAAQNYYASSTIANSVNLPILVTFTDGKETNKYLNNSNNSCETSTQRMLEYNGKNPDSGNIFIDKNGNVSMAIYNKEVSKCATIGPKDKTITIQDLDQSECVLTETPC